MTSVSTPSIEQAPVQGHARAAGIALMLGSAGSNQFGAGLGASAFATIGPVGVVAIRQMVTAAVLTPIVRPQLRGLTGRQWWPIAGLAIAFGVMNFGLYYAVDRIGLGLAVTLEFLGPLAVAVAGSRRAFDMACAVAAGVGVVVLTNPGPSSDILGISSALLAACAWAGYILLNTVVGQRVPGLEGTALASLVSAIIWAPIAVVWFSSHTPTAAAIALAAACALFSSVVPYVADVTALRRIPAPVFSTVASVNPVFAALVGAMMLGQVLTAHEWIGIAVIVASNVVVSARAVGRRGRKFSDLGIITES